MSLVLVDQGEGIALAALVNKTAPQELDLKLFTDDESLDGDTLESDLTEASGSGYAAVELTASSWTVTPGSPTQASYPQVTFTFTGALGNVYGYYIVQRTSGKLVWAEKFAAAFDVQNNGDQIKVTPIITLGSVTGD